MTRRGRRRWPWIVAAVIAVAIVGAILAIPLLLDLERHRGRIETALGEATGWNVEMGELDFSVLRGLALTVNPVRLKAPDGTSSVEVATFAIRANLMPLFRGRLEVREIRLLRPEVQLVRADEKEGWVVPSMPAGESAPPDSGPDPAAGESPGLPDEDASGNRDGAGSGFSVSIDAVVMAGGRLRLEDRTVDPPLTLALEDLEFRLSPESGEIRGAGAFEGDGGRVTFEGRHDSEIALRLFEVRTDVLRDWVGKDLIHAGGTLDGEITYGVPGSVNGRLTANRLGLLAGERPLETAELVIELSAADGAWTADRLELSSDGVRLTGQGSLLPSTSLRLEMQATPIGKVLRFCEGVLPLPLDLADPGTADLDMRLDIAPDGEVSYEARGALSSARYLAGEVLPPVDDLRVSYELTREGELNLRIDQASVGGGPLVGTAKIDSVDPMGTLTVDVRLTDAALGQLVAGFVEQAADTIVGPADIDARMTLDLGGESVDARSLGGRLALGAEGIELPGWDLEGAIRRRLKEKLGKLADLAALVDPDLREKLAEDGSADGPSETPLLDRMSADLGFSELPWKLDRFELKTGHVTALGGGSFDPLEGLVDLRFAAEVDTDLTRDYVDRYPSLRSLVNDAGHLELPLKIRGPLLGPEVDIDVDAALSSALDGAEPEDALRGLLKGFAEKKLSKKNRP